MLICVEYCIYVYCYDKTELNYLFSIFPVLFSVCMCKLATLKHSQIGD